PLDAAVRLHSQRIGSESPLVFNAGDGLQYRFRWCCRKCGQPRDLPRITVGRPVQLLLLLGQSLRSCVRVRTHNKKLQALLGAGDEWPIGRVRASEVHAVRREFVPSYRASSVQYDLKLVDDMKMRTGNTPGSQLVEGREGQVRIATRANKWS